MTVIDAKERHDLEERRDSRLLTPTHLEAVARRGVAAALNAVLADVFALYMKTKNFHWHMSGPHFRDYQLLLDKQADQLLRMTDPIAERVRKIGGLTLALDRTYHPRSAALGQRCRICRTVGHAGRAARRQHDPGGQPAGSSRPLQHVSGYRQREPD